MFNLKKFLSIRNFNHGYKKILGVIAIVLGFISLVTPFTPGAFWLIFIGLEMMGVHIIFLSRIEEKLKSLNSKVKGKLRRKKKEGL